MVVRFDVEMKPPMVARTLRHHLLSSMHPLVFIVVLVVIVIPTDVPILCMSHPRQCCFVELAGFKRFTSR